METSDDVVLRLETLRDFRPSGNDPLIEVRNALIVALYVSRYHLPCWL